MKLIIEEFGKPKQLYSDEESSSRSKELFGFIHENNIKTIQTSTHAHTVERFIYTFKMNLYRRLDALDQDKNEWTKHVSSIITKYHNTAHSTKEIKPSEAVKPSNHLWVSWHLQNTAKKYRKYEDIKSGDMVRANIKKLNFQNLMTLIGVQQDIKWLMLEVNNITFQV